MWLTSIYLYTRRQKRIGNIKPTISIVHRLGFALHNTKSILKLTQKIEFLGFLIDKRNMIDANEKEKADHIMKITKISNNPSLSIRQLASIIGSVVSIF